MADRITLEVTRYQPELSTTPEIESYEVPLRPEWTVLDGLNYIKDQIDAAVVSPLTTSRSRARMIAPAPRNPTPAMIP